MNNKIRIVAFLGILLMIFGAGLALKQYGPTNPGSFLDTIYDGETVRCDLKIDAELIGTPLRITSQVCYAQNDPCIVSPAKSLFIGDRKGTAAMYYEGRLYDTADVEENAFSTKDGAYVLSACLPENARSVEIAILNENGGKLNGQTVTIQ